MLKTLILFFAVTTSAYAQTNAVEALRKYIPTYDYSGVNGAGQNCSIDMYSRSGGIMVEFVMPRFSKFLVRPEMSFELKTDFLKISAPSLVEDGGLVTNSIVFQGREVRLERNYCLNGQCWVSGSSCHLDPW